MQDWPKRHRNRSKQNHFCPFFCRRISPAAGLAPAEEKAVARFRTHYEKIAPA
jgi:hypothetical protein